MDDSGYDETSRFLLRYAGAPLMHWLLALDATHVRCEGWLDSVLTLRGKKERICDALVRLADLDDGGAPCAGIIEFQTVPDPNMLGRLLVAGGICWQQVKPNDLPGDRFKLAAVVVNLTGEGNSGCSMALGAMRWIVQPRELNLATLDAAVVLEAIASGSAPAEVLAWIPLMKNGCEDAIMRRWKEIAAAENDLARRGVFALAVVFAGAVDRKEDWSKALEGFTMQEPPIVVEWKAAARSEGRREGNLEGKAKLVVLVLRDKFKSLPEDLVARIEAGTDSERFDQWMRFAVTASSVEQFRNDAGL